MSTFLDSDDTTLVRWVETPSSADRVVCECARYIDGVVLVNKTTRALRWAEAAQSVDDVVVTQLKKQVDGHLVTRRMDTFQLVCKGRNIDCTHAWDVVEASIKSHGLRPWYMRDGDSISYTNTLGELMVLTTVPLALVHILTTFGIDVDEELNLRGVPRVPEEWYE